MPNEIKSIEAARGVGNLAFYRMCAEYPNHDDREIIWDKILFISRVYSVSRGLGGEWEALAKAIQRKGTKLDAKIADARRLPFLRSIETVIETHAYLDRIVCKTLDSAGNVANGRASFVSKYLHFHAPDAFPILDTLAWAALKQLTPGFRTAIERPTPYARFCERFARLMRAERLEETSLRHIDHKLLALARQ